VVLPCFEVRGATNTKPAAPRNDLKKQRRNRAPMLFHPHGKELRYDPAVDTPRQTLINPQDET